MFLINSSNTNYNIKSVKDKVLIDSNNGKTIDWREKKLKTLDLADSYKRLGTQFENKHFRVKDCGTYLEYKRFKEDHSLKLNQANFCKVRLCPMCAWRRSLKIYGQVSKVMDHMTMDKDYIYLFLTLTVENCSSENLKDTIDLIFKSFNKMIKRKKIKKSIKGYFRALEVTHNLDRSSPAFDTYHPHLHCILAVNKSYFKKSDIYISQSEFTDLWKQSLKASYTPIVHITRFKDRNGQGVAKSIAETAKYTVKSDDYIVKDDYTKEIIEDMTDKAVYTLDLALAHRRLTAFGGILKEIHQELNLDDQEEGNLVHTDNDDLREDLDYIIERYSWNIGYTQYLKVN